MTELNDFYNDGSDWICKRCDSELANTDPAKHSTKVRKKAVGKWMDKTRRVLICPRCGITEPTEKF